MTKRITVPGHTWITGEKAPVIEGWVCRWVNHYGTDRTEFVYHPDTEAQAHAPA